MQLQCGEAGGSEAFRGVMPTGKGTGCIPAERRHEDAAQRCLVYICGVKREEAGVLYGANGGDAPGVEDGGDAFAVGCQAYAAAVEGDLLVHMQRYVLEELERLPCGELVWNIAGEALRPGRVADAFQRNVAVVALQVATKLGRVLVTRAVEVHTAGGFEIAGQALPGEAVCGVAVQVENGEHKRVHLLTGRLGIFHVKVERLLDYLHEFLVRDSRIELDQANHAEDDHAEHLVDHLDFNLVELRVFARQRTRPGR